MKPEEFTKWLASWVAEREGTMVETAQVIVIPDAPYNLYDDKEWLTISWGLIR